MNKALIKMRRVFAFILVTAFLITQSCADLSSDPNASNSKIQIFSPSSNGTLMEGKNEIIYSISQPYSIKFLELYINGIFVKNIPPSVTGMAPSVTIEIDTNSIGQMIDLYLIYYDTDGTSEKSNTVTQVMITNDTRVPFNPYNLSLLKFNDGSVNISWKDSSKFVEKYELWRKINLDGEYLLHQELSGKSFNTNDNNLDTNKIYFYKIRGYKSSGFSDFSDEVNTAGIITSGNLYPPTNLTANVEGESSVVLNWKDNSDNENYFAVQRSSVGGVFSLVKAVTKNITTYLDSGNELEVGSTYQYRIVAYSNEDSAVSNTVIIKITSGILIPPTNLTADYNSIVRVVQLNWDSVDNNILFFEIERKTALTDFALLRRVSSGNNLYLDFTVETNQIYTYRIRGYDLNRFSEYSNEVTVSTF
jgi:hypothetical protein